MLKTSTLCTRNAHFFNDLVEYMTRGPIVAAILEKDNAVDDFRSLDRSY
jgi:nucleoside-diphosphate kinase